MRLPAEEEVDVVILTALELERRAVIAALQMAGAQLLTEAGPYCVAVPPPMDTGNAAAAAGAQEAIDRWRPRRLLLIGVAAGYPGDPRVRLGDVLVPDKIVGYEAGKQTGAGFRPDPEPHRPSYDLLSAARAVRHDEWVPFIEQPQPAGRGLTPTAHVGTLFTGEKVLADPKVLMDLRRGWRNTVGAEMEALGVATASYRAGPGFLVVKGVCDHANQRKNDLWQAYAAEAAVRFGLAVLRRAPFPARRRIRPPESALPFTGILKLQVCERLVNDWRRLADYVGIQPYETARFPRGRGPHEVWDWLAARNRLRELPSALADIGRADLLPLFDERWPNRFSPGRAPRPPAAPGNAR